MGPHETPPCATQREWALYCTLPQRGMGCDSGMCVLRGGGVKVGSMEAVLTRGSPAILSLAAGLSQDPNP